MNEKYYAMGGYESVEETANSVAKEVTVPGTDEVRYYIKVHKNELLNPNNGDFFRVKGKLSTWKKVSPEVFVLYIRFLQSGTERYFNYASRNIQQ